jgi:hypothetical protein
MGKRSPARPEPEPDPGAPVAVAPPPQGRSWPGWACWLVSVLLLFHITAILVCEAAGQVRRSPLQLDLGSRFWWYPVLLHQEIAHAYFAPEPDRGTPILRIRLEFADRRPDREIRLPDPATRPRIRFLRQIGLAWHLVNEGSPKGQPYWAASYARHLCRSNPGCTRVFLYKQYHFMPEPAEVVREVSRGEAPDLDSPAFYTGWELIGAFSCDEF